jgi:uncharacterized glyoxalase superfamily protein PhnB
VSSLNAIEVITLFVDDLTEARAFYQSAFEAEVTYQDDVSCVYKFEGVMINLLQSTEALELVRPIPLASARSGARALLTIKVRDVDAACATLKTRGVVLLNGPTNRPWGRRTAAFSDSSGHVWEIAQEIG